MAMLSGIFDNPFPGLRPYEAGDAPLFFGREQHTQAIIKKLTQHHFISVVGYSGSGKSSLIKAGVLPTLQKGVKGDAGEEWNTLTLRPGNSPLQELQKALCSAIKANPEDATRIQEMLESGNLGLLQVIRTYFPKDKNILILVDQFEEIFKDEGDLSEKKKFVGLLLDPTRQYPVPLHIIITIRSDFLGDCARFDGLPEAINQGQFLIPRMNRYELKSVIEGPIHQAGGRISPVLVHQLLGGMGDDQDQLPVLQHCLMRMWQSWEEENEAGVPIDIRHYEMTGGLEKSLNNHADEIWKKLQYGYKEEIASRIFKCITELKDGRGYRRPVSFETLKEITGASEQIVREVLDVFRAHDAAFILPSGEYPIQPETSIDIPHESLMRLWERLRRWSVEEENSAEMFRRLSGSALRYSQGLSALWRDPELQLALDWRDFNKPNEAWANLYDAGFNEAILFLERSKTDRERLRKEARRRSFISNISLLSFLIILSVLTIWAFQQRNIAQYNAADALKEKKNALESELLARQESQKAKENAQIAREQKSLAENQSKEAYIQKGLALQNAQNAQMERNKALEAFQRANFLQEQEKMARKQAEEAKEVAERSKNDALDQKKKAEAAAKNIVRLRNQAIALNMAAKSLQMTKKYADTQLKGLLALKALKLIRENGGDEKSSEIINALYGAIKSIEGRQAFSNLSHGDDVRSVCFMPENDDYVSGGNDGKVIMYDGKKGQMKYFWSHPNAHAIISVLALHDGRILAIPESGALWIFSTSQGNFQVKSIPLPPGRNMGLSVLQKQILIWQQDKVNIWDPVKETFNSPIQRVGQALPEIIRLLGNNHALVRLNQQDKICYVTGLADYPLMTEVDYPIPIKGITQCLITSQWWAAAYQDGAMLAGGYAINAHQSSVNCMMSSGNDKLVTCAMDGTVKIWNVSDFTQQPIVFSEHDSWVWDLDVKGNQILSGSRDRQVIRYLLETLELEKWLKNLIHRGMTEKEWKFYVGNDIPWDNSW